MSQIKRGWFRTPLRSKLAALSAVALISAAASSAHAWDPPDGPSTDQATQPATPTTLVNKAHGYIIQNGISILNNDGFWAAAQELWQSQNFPELLNGVRYADVWNGRQAVNFDACELYGAFCQTLDPALEDASWPYAADNHYYNPDTGLGLQAGFLTTAAYWGPILEVAGFQWVFGGLFYLAVQVDPSMQSPYQSALALMDSMFANAVSAYNGGSPPSINGRSGKALAMFYLGWASHLMQDQAVAHHTFDEPRKHHAEYEGWADAHGTPTAPIWDGAFTAPPSVVGLTGTYSVPVQNCTAGSSACFGAFLNINAHNSSTLAEIDNANGQDTAAVTTAIPMAESAQAGLYAAFFAAVGRAPVRMTAAMGAINLPLLM